MTTPYAEAPATRPTLLTIICILSFLFGIWGLYGGVQSAFTDKPQRDLETTKAELEKTLASPEVQGPGAEMVAKMGEQAIAIGEKSVENAKPIGYSSIVLSIVSLLGVWWMWNLQKKGFWLYTLATVVGLITPFIFLGGGMMTLLGVGFLAVISIIFVILYAVNLKHMR
jgi:CHASE2 domain-containing sensor protein